MLKNFGLQVPKTGMVHAAFMAHWLNVHAPLSAPVSGVRGYVVNEIIDRCDDAASTSALRVEPAIQGIAQLWFDSQEAMAVVGQTPEAKRWFSDGANYLGARTGIATSERTVMPPAADNTRPRWKLMILIARAAGSTAAQFAVRYETEHARTVNALPGLRAYVQSTVRAVNPATNMPAVQVAPVDAIDELWFDSEGAARAAGKLLLRAAGSSACCWLARETVVISPPRAHNDSAATAQTP